MQHWITSSGLLNSGSRLAAFAALGKAHNEPAIIGNVLTPWSFDATGVYVEQLPRSDASTHVLRLDDLVYDPSAVPKPRPTEDAPTPPHDLAGRQ